MKSLIPKILTITFLSLIILQSFFFVSYKLLAETAQANENFKKPVLQVTIPGLNFSDAKVCEEDEDKYCVSWISEYIIAIYIFGISIAGIIAAVVLAYAGILYVAAGGSPDKIGQAKNYIAGALAGLVLMLTSYLILNMINPQLTTFVPLEIGKVEPSVIVKERSEDSYTNCVWSRLTMPASRTKKQVDNSICENLNITAGREEDKKYCYCQYSPLEGCADRSACHKGEQKSIPLYCSSRISIALGQVCCCKE